MEHASYNIKAAGRTSIRLGRNMCEDQERDVRCRGGMKLCTNILVQAMPGWKNTERSNEHTHVTTLLLVVLALLLLEELDQCLRGLEEVLLSLRLRAFLVPVYDRLV